MEPIQRGGVDGAGSAAFPGCALLDGPCPKANSKGSAVMAYFSGDELWVNMLKNQDHYLAGAKGNFTAYLWDAQGNKKFIGSTPDSAAPSLTQYRVRSPDVLKNAQPGNYTVQTIYYTNNPQAPPAFFQCSDITVLGQNAESLTKKHEHNHGPVTEGIMPWV